MGEKIRGGTEASIRQAAEAGVPRGQDHLGCWGVLACQELHGALGLTEAAPTYLRETRGGRNVQHELVPLLRQSVYSRLAGYEDTNDAVRLARDPTMQAASTNTLSWFETEVLVTEENLKGLNQLNAEWVDQAMMRTRHQRIILNMDSSESPVYGEQEGAAYNGHFECVCYHPLFCFNQFGDCEGAMLRPVNEKVSLSKSGLGSRYNFATMLRFCKLIV